MAYNSLNTGAQVDAAIDHYQMKYYPDASESDQGATASGSGDTIYDILQAVGTSKYATIVLTHTGSGNTTTYTLDTSINLTSYPYIFILPEPGARLARTTGDELLTVYSPENLIIGKRQQITSVDMLRFAMAGIIHAEWWGAIADASTDSRIPIQIAIDVASASSGGTINLFDGTYLCSTAGQHPNIARNYGLMLKSNIKIIGQGKFFTALKSDDDTEMDLLVTPQSTAISNFIIQGIKIDGNEAGQTSGGFNIWIYNASYFSLFDIHSYNPGSWGVRIEQSTDFNAYDIKTNHSAESNSDGIHLVDVSFVGMDKIDVYTEGDDGFIIEALSTNCHDITIGEITVRCPNQLSLPARAIALFLDDSVAVQNRTIYNVNIKNATTYNSAGPGCIVSAAVFYNININLTDYGSKYALYLGAGCDYVGAIRNCTFNINSYKPDEQSVVTVLVNGSIEYNHLILNAYDPGDGYVGATIKGSYWIADINMAYDPEDNKSSPSYGIDIFSTYSNFRIGAVTNANKGMYFRSGASGNTILLGRIGACDTYTIELVSGANYNKFIGGSIASAQVNNGTGNVFAYVSGAT